MDDQERYLLERAQEELRSAVALLPQKKDPRVTLVKEFLGADEEGPAMDVLLVVGEAQEASPEFWQMAARASRSLGADGQSAWLSPEARKIWTERCSDQAL